MRSTFGPPAGRCPPISDGLGRPARAAWAGLLTCGLLLGCSGEKPPPDPCSDGVPNLRVSVSFDPSTCPPAPKDVTAELSVYVGDDIDHPVVVRSGLRSGDTVELEVPATYYHVLVDTPGWEPEPGSGDTADSEGPPGLCDCYGREAVRLFCDGPAAELEMELECS